MLILTRRPDETLYIGSEVTVTILAIKGQQVRIGIRAPKDVVVDREEVHVRKQHEATAALHPTSTGCSVNSASGSSESRAFHSTLRNPVEKTAAGFSTEHPHSPLLEPGEKTVPGFSPELAKQVRIGIAAPKHLVVDRQEIFERKQHEAAAITAPTQSSVE